MNLLFVAVGRRPSALWPDFSRQCISTEKILVCVDDVDLCLLKFDMQEGEEGPRRDARSPSRHLLCQRSHLRLQLRCSFARSCDGREEAQRLIVRTTVTRSRLRQCVLTGLDGCSSELTGYFTLQRSSAHVRRLWKRERSRALDDDQGPLQAGVEVGSRTSSACSVLLRLIIFFPFTRGLLSCSVSGPSPRPSGHSSEERRRLRWTSRTRYRRWSD